MKKRWLIKLVHIVRRCELLLINKKDLRLKLFVISNNPETAGELAAAMAEANPAAAGDIAGALMESAPEQAVAAAAAAKAAAAAREGHCQTSAAARAQDWAGPLQAPAPPPPR